MTDTSRGKLSVTLRVVVDLKCVLKEDTGHVEYILSDVSPSLTQLSGDVSFTSFCPEGFVDIGVSIGNDSFVQNFNVMSQFFYVTNFLIQ
jgi:hypothetical protein